MSFRSKRVRDSRRSIPVVILPQLPHARVAGPVPISIVQAAPTGHHLQTRVDHSREKAVLERLMEIPHLPQLFLDPALFDEVLEPAQPLCRKIIRLNRFIRCLGRQHAGLECKMNSFQPHRIQEAGGIADNQSAIEVILRQRPITAFRNRLRAVGIQRTAFENTSDVRMRFEFLKALVRIEARIEIVQTRSRIRWKRAHPPCCR